MSEPIPAKTPAKADKPSKILTAYLRSGRSREQFFQALSEMQPLSGYETEVLAAARIEVEENRRFLEVSKALLRESRFHELISEAKGDELEGRKATKNQTARLIYRIMEAIEQPVRSKEREPAARTR